MANRVERVLDLYEENRKSLRSAIVEVGGNPDAILDIYARQLLKNLSMNEIFVRCLVLGGWEDGRLKK